MNTLIICFYKENQGTYHTSIIKYAPQEVLCSYPLKSAHITLKCALIRKIFYYIFFKHTVIWLNMVSDYNQCTFFFTSLQRHMMQFK